MSRLPLKPVRAILGQNCPFPISDDAVVLLRDSLEEFIDQVGSVSIREFKELNNNRKRQGLRPLKRLNGWSIRKACDNILKPETVNDMGLRTNGIVSLGGNIMHTNVDATKSAKKIPTNTGVPNGL